MNYIIKLSVILLYNHRIIEQYYYELHKSDLSEVKLDKCIIQSILCNIVTIIYKNEMYMLNVK